MERRNTINQSDSLIKIFPDIMLAAMQRNYGGSYRLWFLGKHFNLSGSSVINNEYFRSFAINEVGISSSTYYSWLEECLQINLIKNNQAVLQLLGYKEASVLVDCYIVGTPVYLKINELFKRSWQGKVYAGFLKSRSLENRPISRKSLRELSSVPERTQREYDKQAGIISQSNFAKDINRPGIPEMISYINEFEREKIKSKAFLKNGKIYWRRPNSYQTQDIKKVSNGSSKRINQQLKDLRLKGGRVPDDKPIIRINCKNYKQLEASKRKIRRLANNGEKDLPEYIYLQSGRKGYYNAEDVS